MMATDSRRAAVSHRWVTPPDITELTAYITVFAVSAVAFWWSANALHGIAMDSGMSSALAWGAPVLFDGPIVQATFCLVTLRKRKRLGVPVPTHLIVFLWCELAVAELLSLLGNGMHAWRADNLEVDQLIAAGVAGVAPVAAIAMTHALTELLDVPRTADPAGTQVPPVSGGFGTSFRGGSTARNLTVPEGSSAEPAGSTLELEGSSHVLALESAGHDVEPAIGDHADGDHGPRLPGTQVPPVSGGFGTSSRGGSTGWNPTVPEGSSAEPAGSTPERGGSSDESEPPVLDEATRNARMAEMRKQGLSFRVIGEEFGLSHTQARRILASADLEPDADEGDDWEEGPRLTLVTT